METMRLLSSTETNSGSITHAVKGCFRHPGQPDVLLARYNSLQLCSFELNRFEDIQPLFVPILQLQTFSWRETAFLHPVSRVSSWSAQQRSAAFNGNMKLYVELRLHLDVGGLGEGSVNNIEFDW